MLFGIDHVRVRPIGRLSECALTIGRERADAENWSAECARLMHSVIQQFEGAERNEEA